MPDISPSNTPSNALTNDMLSIDPTLAPNSDSMIATQKAVNTSIQANKRKAYVNGSQIGGVTPYLVQTSVVSGAATLWLTSDGTSTGNAVFSAIYPQGIVINAYGTGNNYQVYNVTVSSDLKSVTCNVNQMAGAVLGLVNVTSAASGVDVRGIILGTLASS